MEFPLARHWSRRHDETVLPITQQSLLPWVQRRSSRVLIAGCALACSILLATWANVGGWRATTALLLVFGVTLTGGLVGLRGGLIAGLVTSFIYNFFLSDPLFRLSFSSADDLLPIIALNFSAVASGWVAGRLRDKAEAAEELSLRVQSLLLLSQNLQRAVSLQEMRDAAQTSLDRVIEIHLSEPRSDTANRGSGDISDAPVSGDPELLQSDDCVAMPIGSDADPIGTIIARTNPTDATEDARGYLAVLSIAIERLVLSERLVDTHVLRRSEAFKTTLLSSVSHDLRTPLSAISASASSLRRYKDSLDKETQIDLLNTIQEQCERLNRLTTNLLNLGRIEGGLDPATMPLVDAVDSLGSALTRARMLQEGRTIEKSMLTSSALVRADAVMLEQMFFNVLDNAVVHTPEATVIQVHAQARDGVLRVMVEDAGPGIPKGDRERVFERFYQVPSRRDGRVGSGLGLSIARGFARSIGGDVQVTDRGTGTAGTRLIIELPLETDNPNGR